jgi:hypothetical protein
MRRDEYYRLHAACLAMARQSTEPHVRARWVAMAEVWLKQATEPDERSLPNGRVEAKRGLGTTGAPDRGTTDPAVS